MRLRKQMVKETAKEASKEAPQGISKRPPRGLPTEPPTTLLEYGVYALGIVILCALLAAFYFIDKPTAFRRFW
ncbi:MAG: hypothetical protein RO009_20265 [Pseudorhodoplanes sp.]|jgi:hypothetical protein|nr:hypothetical protein [Pseudorhodoplanes sp.]